MQAIRRALNALTYPFRMLARVPGNLVSSPRRIAGLSLPARIGIVTLFAVLTVILIWLIVRYNLPDGRENFADFLKPKALRIVLMLIFIPLTVWVAMKLWLEGGGSPFPEIDRVLEEANVAFRKQSIDPLETPIFVVLGPESDATANRLLAGTSNDFTVNIHGPVQVFANRQSIYFVCTNSCSLGTLFDSSFTAIETGDGRRGGDKTMDLGQRNSPPTMTQTEEIVGPQKPVDMNQDHDRQRTDATNNAAGIAGGTYRVQNGAVSLDLSKTKVATQAPRLDQETSEQARQQLTYLCQRIKRLREPLCPINGVLVSTPFAQLIGKSDEARVSTNHIQTALKSDLCVLRSVLRVRCGVIHIISEMQEEAGFRELIRRVGHERAARQRIGKGFFLWNPPVKNQLDALVRQACGAIEDASYELFQEEDGLGKRNNRHLCLLLCKLRSGFTDRLSNLVQQCYSIEPASMSAIEREPLLFSGCYFVASGKGTLGHSFIAGVFEKLHSEDSELVWGDEAIDEERRMQTGVMLLVTLSGILFATIVAIIAYHQFK